MNKILLSALLGTLAIGSLTTAEARPDRGDRGDYRYRSHRYGSHRYESHRYTGSRRYADRSRTIYVIHNHRPVRRVVYIDANGSYYRIANGRRVRVRERYYTSYPSRYYYPDGRRRIGISLNF